VAETKNAAEQAVNLTKEFSLFVLKSCLVLNGGAILAILGLLGTLENRPQPLFRVQLGWVKVSVGFFVAGLVATILAGVGGYLNFLWGQAPTGNQRIMNVARLAATASVIFAVLFFILGAVSVMASITSR
jgi:hypothetical protein